LAISSIAAGIESPCVEQNISSKGKGEAGFRKTALTGPVRLASFVGKERGSIGTRIIFSFFRFQPERRKAFRLTSFPIT